MSSIIASTFVAMLWILPIVVLGGVARIARARYHRKDRRNPLTKGMLRGPGHSLKEQLEELQLDLATYIAVTSPMPLLALAFWSVQQQVAVEGLQMHWLFAVVMGTGGVAFGAFKIVRLVKNSRNIRLGLEAETAVGQELDQLMKDGFSVYHDVAGDKAFNIDHVVVGPQGVFAVETKGRSKPVKSGGEGHRVEYNDGRLLFPGWVEKAPLDQAKRNADWLRKWLSSAVGAPVNVKPVLMLPGWYVENKSRPAVAVMNGTNCRGFFTKCRDEPLGEQLVRQIVHQLDTRCRDVEPRSYRPVRD